MIASLGTIFTGWTPIDPILSVFVALIILRSALVVVRESGHNLIEGAPTGFDRRAVADAIVDRVPGVTRAHHIHAWSITLEVDVTPGIDVPATRDSIKDLLRDSFDMEHSTVEITEATTN